MDRVSAQATPRHTSSSSGRLDLRQESGKLSRQHGTGGIAKGHGGGTGIHGSADHLLQESTFAAGGIVGNEFHIAAEGLTGRNRIGNGGQHGLRLLVEQIFHLNRADRGTDLQSRLLGLLQRVPGALHTLTGKLHRHGDHAVGDGGGNGLDPQAVHPGIGDAFQLDHIHAQLVQQLRQLDLLLEGQAEAFRRLLHGHFADSDFLHDPHSLKKEKP